jgi:hypothetical protein
MSMGKYFQRSMEAPKIEKLGRYDHSIWFTPSSKRDLTHSFNQQAIP